MPHGQVVHDRIDVASIDRLAAHRAQLEMDELAIVRNGAPALAKARSS
jgi:hypothetical protein